MSSKELLQILTDFVRDILTTFPEYEKDLHPGLAAIHSKDTENPILTEVFDHCKKIYPEKFFDILYQKEELFNSSTPLYFLPQIDFRDLWKLDISDNTRMIIWKYLQLILFSVVHLQDNGETFGDTAKLFEAIDEAEFKNKLEETIQQMTEIFNASGENMAPDTGDLPLPDVDKLQEHISSMLEGNLGNLAKEIAEETAAELTEDMGDITTVGDVFKKLFRNPGKLMGLVKKVGTKLDSKLQSGEMQESDLIREASELITKMNKMPGMQEMNQVLGQMGLPTGGKMNMGALQAQMAQNMKAATTRERLQRKLEKKRAAAAAAAMMQQAQPTQVHEDQKNPKKKKKKRRKKRKNKK